MRFFAFGLLATLLLTMVAPAAAQERRVDDLTANDLAEALGVHWWIVKLPVDFGPKDMVGVEAISSDGKVLQGGGGFSPQGHKLGREIRVYCYEKKADNQAWVVIRTEGGEAGVPFDDFFKMGGVGGASNGSVLNVDDVLLKFSKVGSFTGGNELEPGQVGLKVVITHRP